MTRQMHQEDSGSRPQRRTIHAAGSARDYRRPRAPIAHLRKLRDSRDPLSAIRARTLERSSLKWVSPAFSCPEDNGGSALGHVEAGVVMEEIGRNLTPSPFLSTALLGVTALESGRRARRRTSVEDRRRRFADRRSPATRSRGIRQKHVETKATRAGNVSR